MASFVMGGCGAVPFDDTMFIDNDGVLSIVDGVVAVANATPTTAGIVKQSANVPDVEAAPTMEEFNALLTALQNAGIMATE